MNFYHLKVDSLVFALPLQLNAVTFFYCMPVCCYILRQTMFHLQKREPMPASLCKPPLSL